MVTVQIGFGKQVATAAAKPLLKRIKAYYCCLAVGNSLPPTPMREGQFLVEATCREH